MTRQSTFKKKIRARMARTGERYAAARLALLRSMVDADAPESAATRHTLLTDLGPLAAALRHAGVVDPGTGRPFTETRLFGLSGGPGFMAFVFRYKGVPPMVTFTCRSFSLPGPVVDRALEHAGVVAERVETGSAAKAARTLDAALDAGRVVHAAVDQARLPWMGHGPEWQGQWPRHIDVLGRVDGGYRVRDQADWTMSPDALAAARAGVKKVKHRALTFPAAGAAAADPVEATRRALAFYARNQREAPFAGYANNFGLAGLARTAQRMADTTTKDGWGRMFGTGPAAFGALWRIWACIEVELTTPAGGRLLFADFLDEAAAQPGMSDLADVAGQMRRCAAEFEAVADAARRAGGALLEQAVELTEDIDERRRSGDVERASGVAGLLIERSALADRCTLDAAARAAAFADIAAHLRQLTAAETRAVEMVEAVLDA